MPQHKITQTFTTVLKRLCRYPQDLEITERFEPAARSLKLRLEPNRADYPILHGTGRRQINSIKLFFKHACRRAGLTGDVELIETDRGEREDSPFLENPQFDVVQFREDLQALCSLCFDSVKTKESVETRIFIEPSGDDLMSETLIKAIDDIFFPYGQRNGRKIKIRLEQE